MIHPGPLGTRTESYLMDATATLLGWAKQRCAASYASATAAIETFIPLGWMGSLAP